MRGLRAALGRGLLAAVTLAGVLGKSAYKPNLPPRPRCSSSSMPATR
jgi:hypothetical protein